MQNQNTTLLLIKPDAIKKKYAGKIITILEEKNLNIIKIKMLTLTHDIAEKFYLEHKNKSFYKELIEFITSGPVIALVIEGDNIIIKIRDLIGHTDYKKANLGTIRNLFASSITENAVHASDNIISANKEINIFF